MTYLQKKMFSDFMQKHLNTCLNSGKLSIVFIQKRLIKVITGNINNIKFNGVLLSSTTFWIV